MNKIILAIAMLLTPVAAMACTSNCGAGSQHNGLSAPGGSGALGGQGAASGGGFGQGGTSSK